MSQISIVKKLDIVLNAIKKNEPKTRFIKVGSIDTTETTDGKTKFHDLGSNKEILNMGIIATDLQKILDYLMLEKYIELGDYQRYKTTIAGELFIGFEKTEILQNDAIKTSQNNAYQAKTYADRLLFATWCAGIAAVLLLLWQVFVYFYPVHKDYPYWIWETIPKKLF